MTYLSQCLGSRVPPLDSALPLSLALMYNRIAWDGLWMPPCTLLRVLFEGSCTINTCILHIFDVFDIRTNNYNTCIFTHLWHLWHHHNLQYILNILWHAFVWQKPRCISWWRSWWSMRCHLSCTPHLDGCFMKSPTFIFLSSFLGVCFVLTIFISTNSTN